MSSLPMTFEEKYNLSRELLQSLERLGYDEPTTVQDAVLSYLPEKKDYIVQSQTGSGKTAAFGIPIIEGAIVNSKNPQALILTPTRELAVQVCEELSKIGKYKKIRCCPIYGKQQIHIQIEQLKQRVHIVVGTPGRVADLIAKGYLKLQDIQYLVLDEADELLKKGFLPEVKGIISQVPQDRQTFLFSATIPEEIGTICEEDMKDPVNISIQSELPPIEMIEQRYYEVAEDWKDIQLKKILDRVRPQSCLIFCNTQKKADEVYHYLKRSGTMCETLHGGMNQRDRLNAISGFKNKEIKVLVATDLAARGIHVDELELVINYSIPMDEENYVHRIGRTGRAGHIGRAISFVSVHDVKNWKSILQYIGYKVPLGDIDEFDETMKKEPARTQETKKTIKPIKEKKPSKEAIKEFTMIRIGLGKQKKIRAVDVVGTISSIEGILPEDIGIIDIRDSCTYVEIFNHKGKRVVEALENKTIKGKHCKVVEIHKPKKN